MAYHLGRPPVGQPLGDRQPEGQLRDELIRNSNIINGNALECDPDLAERRRDGLFQPHSIPSFSRHLDCSTARRQIYDRLVFSRYPTKITQPSRRNPKLGPLYYIYYYHLDPTPSGGRDILPHLHFSFWLFCDRWTASSETMSDLPTLHS